ANCRTGSHRPPDGHGHGLDSVGNRITALCSLALNLVGVSANLRGQNGMINKNLALSNHFERVRHGSGRLRLRLCVTRGARSHTARIGLRHGGCRKKQTQKLPAPSHHGLETATSFWPLSRKNSSRSFAASVLRPALA